VALYIKRSGSDARRGTERRETPVLTDRLRHARVAPVVRAPLPSGVHARSWQANPRLARGNQKAGNGRVDPGFAQSDHILTEEIHRFPLTNRMKVLKKS
jgi:hypothetical protein